VTEFERAPREAQSAIRFSQRFRGPYRTSVDCTRSRISPWQIARIVVEFILSGALAFRGPLAWPSRVCHSARPGFPASPDRFGVARNFYFFQPIHAFLDRLRAIFPLLFHRFKERPQERQGKKTPGGISRRLFYFLFRVMRSGSVPNGQPNCDADSKRAQQRRDGILA